MAPVETVLRRERLLRRLTCQLRKQPIQSCHALSNSLRCDNGFCRSNTGVVIDAGGVVQEAGTTLCVRGQVGASEVLFLGDSFIVIMDGGGGDVSSGTCDNPPTASCPVVVNAAAAAQRLLSRMAQDGVQHVVYFFYPDPLAPRCKRKSIY